MRNYVYISNTKLDVYFGQAAEKLGGGSTSAAKLTLGVVSLERKESQSPVFELHQKIEAIERFLDDGDLIGDENSTKEWVSGTAELTGITAGGGATIFLGPLKGSSRDIVALLASRRHILGRDGNADIKDDLSYHEKQRPVGRLGIEFFESNSNTLSYGHLLRDAFKPEQLAERIDFSFESKEALLAVSNGVTPSDIEGFPELDEFYPTLLRVWQGERAFEFLDFGSIKKPRGSFLQWFINLFRRPILRWKFGTDKFTRYIQLTEKRWWYEKWVESRLDADEKAILESVYQVATSRLTGRKNQIDFLARVLLSGHKDSGSETKDPVRVVVLSPLWMAIK